MIRKEWKKYYVYLEQERLRQTKVIGLTHMNIYKAAPRLAMEFKLLRKDAKTITRNFVANYDSLLEKGIIIRGDY